MADAAQVLSLSRAGERQRTVRSPLYAGQTVRRLTVEECESLQGFLRSYTAITYKRKSAKDGPRYKAIGNSMAVPVVRWVLTRLEQVDALDPQERG
jgi:DNA (cytosine-5)-methyltransferase 1